MVLLQKKWFITKEFRLEKDGLLQKESFFVSNHSSKILFTEFSGTFEFHSERFKLVTYTLFGALFYLILSIIVAGAVKDYNPLYLALFGVFVLTASFLFLITLKRTYYPYYIIGSTKNNMRLLADKSSAPVAKKFLEQVMLARVAYLKSYYTNLNTFPTRDDAVLVLESAIHYNRLSMEEFDLLQLHIRKEYGIVH